MSGHRYGEDAAQAHLFAPCVAAMHAYGHQRQQLLSKDTPFNMA